MMASLRAAFSFGGNQTNQKRDAARHDISEFSGWRPNTRFAGTTNYGDADTIRNRARSLDEDNGWINAGLDRRVESVIGSRIRLSAQPRHELLNRDYAWRMGWTALVQSRYEVWANDIEHRNDARQRLSFGAQAKLAYLTYARDGACAAEIRDNARGISNTTNVLLIEPERVSHPQDRGLMESPRLRNGFAYDENGAALGAYVRSAHPADPNAGFETARWDYIPMRGPTGRAKFLYCFSPRRVEQERGVSKLAEVMVPAKMLDRADRAEVNAALKAAIFSLFIKSPGTTDDLEGALNAPTGDNESGVDPWIDAYLGLREKQPVYVEGAQVTHLLPGEEVQAPNASHPNSNYADFANFILRKVAGSLGVAPPQLSGDWVGINYSSARAMLNELWRSFLEDRHYFTQHFLTPIYAAWLEVEVANGDVKIPGGPANFYRNKTAICMCEWIGPGRGSVDPLKEANANNLDEAAGRKSVVESILETGRDPSDVLAEEDWYLKERARRGLPEINRNVKAAPADSEESGTGATQDDRDGDGIPQEDKRKKPQKEPAQ
ncbi:phage portal protein [Novosphingobium sp. KN65.2]|uniref:phage portal protein n=1 Tax=Novosphingobium sp. KN65.2 TaxID=1478134 RepID=UPI0005DF8E92|nr:phage portal protein [Novosphingobium sp. KN65.2]CDO34055.1 putative Phage portal protein, lambda family [Novosphingobium sp. KN65.2]